MPTYAYRGTECGHEFETYQSFSDDPLTECLECSGPVRKVISSVGVTFKGSGFYRTDSRSESSSGKRAGKDSSSKDSGSKDSGSKESGGKESKPKDGSAKKDSAKKKATSSSAAS
ncbi:FmdB family zinc ribbon protein [Salana multivorans]